MKTPNLRTILVLAGALSMLGCSAATPRADDSVMTTPAVDGRAVTIRHGDGSGTADWDSVVADMASAKAVLIGEMHGHELGLAVGADLFEDIVGANPLAILSMEFYERDEQVALDDYLAGITDREQFLAASGRTASNNPPAHERMVQTAKNAGRPVIAANSPRRYTKLARTDGYEALRSLTDRQRVLFDIPPYLRTESAYHDRFYEAMGGMASHGGEEMMRGFFRSQALWDRTMATSIAHAGLRGRPVVHVVGYFHIQFAAETGGSGLVDDLRSMYADDEKIVTIIMLDRVDQEILEEDLHIADYVVYVGSDE
jgi:uncharacterized iron-regulated protein